MYICVYVCIYVYICLYVYVIIIVFFISIFFRNWINKLFSEDIRSPEHCLMLEMWQGQESKTV